MNTELFGLVEKPVRYIGQEWNQVVKPPAPGLLRAAFAFPDSYEIGMSHLGLRILYDALNREPDLALERVFCPAVDMEAALRKFGLPLATLETHTPLHALDVVGFSLQFEMEYTNVLTMLDLGGIPLRSEDRTVEHPLVAAGGPCAFSPEPHGRLHRCLRGRRRRGSLHAPDPPLGRAAPRRRAAASRCWLHWRARRASTFHRCIAPKWTRRPALRS